ncbi:MAG: imidazolonepropionase [Bacteroidetes bacterium]|nr:imidazolonepropionase [Bacteroidota bacterium]
MTTIITNIKQLVNVRTENKLLRGSELANLPIIDNAYLVVQDGLIKDFGEMKKLSTVDSLQLTENIIDSSGATILPTYCDSHTHIVFAASRESEFVDKINGLTYADIAAKGGGILNSANKLANTSEEDLYNLAYKRLQEVIKLGTGAIEIKSGYGLSVDAEIKMLRVIKELKKNAGIPIKSTFLGAHAFPIQYKENKQAYVNLILKDMLPTIEKENLADYIDAFCEQGFFDIAQTETICKAGINAGLKVKIHANQLSSTGAVQLGVKLNALSVDHLEIMDDDAIKSLASSNTIGTLLPTAAFFLRMHYQPARQLIDAGCAIALASDFNPGSSPSGNMNFVNAVSCIQMKMLPEEVINASTINGAFAMEVENEVGSISVGKKANLIFTKDIPSLAYLPYSFGSNLIDKVMINGVFMNQNNS